MRSRRSLPGLAVFESLGHQSGRRNSEDSNMGTFAGIPSISQETLGKKNGALGLRAGGRL